MHPRCQTNAARGLDAHLLSGGHLPRASVANGPTSPRPPYSANGLVDTVPPLPAAAVAGGRELVGGRVRSIRAADRRTATPGRGGRGVRPRQFLRIRGQKPLYRRRPASGTGRRRLRLGGRSRDNWETHIPNGPSRNARSALHAKLWTRISQKSVICSFVNGVAPVGVA